MCGIAGQISFEEPPSAHHVAGLVHGIRHRGPDDAGLWVSPTKECVLGHTRLSIIDLSPLGHQPMVDPETGNALVFNGEIYNFQVLRKECESAGDTFRSHSDTEVILALYRRHGINCLEKLRGMFAFGLWDDHNQRLFFARDRMGKKPFHYVFSNNRFVFCSEINPLAGHPQTSCTIDMEALELYLQLQYIPAPWTIYEGIRKLPPAQYGVFDRNGLSLNKYWEVDYTKKISISEGDALDGLEELLTEAIRLRMIADVPIGALLSGGVDSSVIVALMAKLSGEPIRTFSMGFRDEAFNELPFARQVAERCGTRHHSEIIEGDVMHLLPNLARHYGEPFADHSAVPSFLVCRAARSSVSVVMNGDGGDELLGGYHRYRLSPAQLMTASCVPDVFSAELRTSLLARLAPAISLPARAIRKLMMEYVWPELRAVPTHNDYWNDFERARLVGAYRVHDPLANWRAHWLAGASAHAYTSVERMLWYDNHTYLAGCLLPKMDIASMQCGLETRSPLLDHKVIEFCANLPMKYKVKNQIGKYLLKKLAERYFPIDFVHRPKKGFGIPLAEWLRGPLRTTLQEVLRDPHAMSPLDRTFIGQTLDEFLLRGIDHSCRLWVLLMFGYWRNQARRASEDQSGGVMRTQAFVEMVRGAPPRTEGEFLC